MAKSLVTQTSFPSVAVMCEQLSLPESKFALGWRLVDRAQGEINGLPNSRGTLIATDGMTCLIIGEDGGLYFGHYDFFVEDVEATLDMGVDGGNGQSNTTKRASRKKILIEFVV